MIISIITISHRDQAGLADTVESLANVRAQYGNVCEWIIVVGQPDDLPFPAPDGAQIILHPPNGIYDAMNAGLARAQGDYVWFLSGGDRMATPDVIHQVLTALAKAPDIIYGDAVELDNPPWRKSARRIKHLPFGMITHHPAIIVRRDIINALGGFDRRFPLAADYHLMLRCWRAGYSFTYIPLAIAAVARGGQSEQNARQGRQEQMLIRQHILHWPGWYCHLWAELQAFSRLIRHVAPGLWRILRGA